MSVTQVANPGATGAAEVTVKLTVTSPGQLSNLGLTPLQPCGDVFLFLHQAVRMPRMVHNEGKGGFVGLLTDQARRAGVSGSDDLENIQP